MLELYYSNFETCANCTFVPMVFNQAHVSISFFFVYRSHDIFPNGGCLHTTTCLQAMYGL